jgi:hypothetical protein
MTNACLSSSFVRTVCEFGSLFGPIAKWPFLNETSFCKEPHFAQVPKTPRKSRLFLKPGFVKNQSKATKVEQNNLGWPQQNNNFVVLEYLENR